MPKVVYKETCDRCHQGPNVAVAFGNLLVLCEECLKAALLLLASRPDD